MLPLLPLAIALGLLSIAALGAEAPAVLRLEDFESAAALRELPEAPAGHRRFHRCPGQGDRLCRMIHGMARR